MILRGFIELSEFMWLFWTFSVMLLCLCFISVTQRTHKRKIPLISVRDAWFWRNEVALLPINISVRLTCSVLGSFPLPFVLDA